MAAVDLCSFNHGLGIYIRLYFPEQNFFLCVVVESATQRLFRLAPFTYDDGISAI